MTQHHVVVPSSLQAAENAFSLCLRADNSKDETYSSGMRLYRKVVRENVINVLNSVFPIFCRDLTDSDISQIADSFIVAHQATQPEFHQLATELLLFMRQQSKLLTDRQQKVVEYEWLLYSLEIDESDVLPPHVRELESLDIHNMEVVKNPTLRIVLLPFLLKNGELNYEDNLREHYYALYRKHNNALYQKALTVADVKLLLEAGNVGIAAEMLKEKSANCLSAQTFEQWLTVNNNDEIISLIKR